MYRQKKEIGYRTNVTDRYCDKQYDREITTKNRLIKTYGLQKCHLEQIRTMKRNTDPEENPKRYADLIRSEKKCQKELRETERRLNDRDYGKHPAIVSKPKKQELTVLEARILKEIANIRKNPEIKYVTKEDMAKTLHARESQIEQVFMVLNRKGILTQPMHRSPHDSTRDPWGYDGSAWQSDFYYFVN